MVSSTPVGPKLYRARPDAIQMLVSHSPWWWMRVRAPGAVVTTDEYSPTEPTMSAEIAIERSISAFWPSEVERSEGVPLYAVETVRMLADRGVTQVAEMMHIRFRANI